METIDRTFQSSEFICICCADQLRTHGPALRARSLAVGLKRQSVPVCLTNAYEYCVQRAHTHTHPSFLLLSLKGRVHLKSNAALVCLHPLWSSALRMMQNKGENADASGSANLKDLMPVSRSLPLQNHDGIPQDLESDSDMMMIPSPSHCRPGAA
jgi:hypothetical protein